MLAQELVRLTTDPDAPELAIVVPTTEPGCPAARALEMEGLFFYEIRCTAPTDYGELFYHFWKLGEPFVIVEHDVVPWPGAVLGLFACPRPWCLHFYPACVDTYIYGLGLTKFHPRGLAHRVWAKLPWTDLSTVVTGCAFRQFGHGPCVHRPAVAHVPSDERPFPDGVNPEMLRRDTLHRRLEADEGRYFPPRGESKTGAELTEPVA